MAADSQMLMTTAAESAQLPLGYDVNGK